MKALRVAIWISVLLPALGLQAQSTQRVLGKGMVFSPTKPSAVKYDCKGASDDRMVCSFTQLDAYIIKPLWGRCTISVHSFVQTFRRDTVQSVGPVTWTTENKPEGDCKFLHESRFTSDGASWIYSARYKVGNKSAQQGILNCAEIKEQEITFGPARKEESEWIDCEAIKFVDGCYSPNFPCLGGPPVIQH